MTSPPRSWRRPTPRNPGHWRRSADQRLRSCPRSAQARSGVINTQPRSVRSRRRPPHYPSRRSHGCNAADYRAGVWCDEPEQRMSPSSAPAARNACASLPEVTEKQTRPTVHGRSRSCRSTQSRWRELSTAVRREMVQWSPWQSDKPRERANGSTMKSHAILAGALVLLVGAIELSNIAPALARGGAASIMNSPGYQRRLQESRQQYSRSLVQTPVIQPRKHRHHHH